jgi:hypothetical protein
MKVFATDLDGTLVHNKKVTETDKEAIAAFKKRIYLVFVQEDH